MRQGLAKCGTAGFFRNRTGWLAVLAMFLLAAPTVAAQEGFGDGADEGSFGLTDFESEVFRLRQKRRELPCEIRVSKPSLWFDFRLHARFEAVIPRNQLRDVGDGIRVVARLTPKERPDAAATLVWDISRKELDREPEGRSTAVGGTVLLGEGEYGLDWLIRDRRGRVCYERKKIKAKLSRGDREVRLQLGPGEFEFFRGVSTWTDLRSAGRGKLHLKLLLNVPPFAQPDRRFFTADLYMFMAIMNRIADDPLVGKLDIVGFNLKDRKVLFRQQGVRAPDYEELFRSIKTLSNHEIQLESLRKGSSARFLSDLVSRELVEPEQPFDAAVFIGPRVALPRKVPEEVLDDLSPSERAVYYLKYRYTPWGGNWKDTISRVVSAGGGREFGVLTPKDLWLSVERMLKEIGKQVKGSSPES